MAPVTRRIIVSGRVQGVFFRDWTVREATRLGLAGWVRNRDDGTVEALATGPATSVAALIAACRHGPERARVDGVEATDAAPEALDGFERR